LPLELNTTQIVNAASESAEAKKLCDSSIEPGTPETPAGWVDHIWLPFRVGSPVDAHTTLTGVSIEVSGEVTLNVEIQTGVRRESQVGAGAYLEAIV
jgi:hypothetical protein